MSLASASGIILTGQFEWRSVTIVGIGAYVTYSLDNLLDWKGEKHLLELTRSWSTGYFVWCAVTIPLGIIYGVVLMLQGAPNLLYLLIVLGFIGIGHIVLTSRPNGKFTIYLWAEHLTVSLVWALATVLIPVYFIDHPVFPQLFRAIAYVWQISWIGAMVRNLSWSVHADPRSRPKLLADVLGEKRLILLLQFVCASTLLLVIVDTVYGYFPWYNMMLSIGPIGISILISKWKQMKNQPRFFEALFYSGGILGAILITVVYYFGESITILK